MWFVSLLLSSLLLFSGCQRKGYDRKQMLALGTVCTFQLPKGTHASVFQEIEAAIATVEDEISRTKETSQIAMLNKHKSAKVDDMVLKLLKEGIAMAQESDGAFNPAIGKLTSLWGVATEHPRVPEEEEIQAVDTAWSHITIDGNQVSIPENMEIDLGAIGKGYAADRVKEVLASHHITNALINLGGNIYAMGEKEEGVPWTIGLRDPNGSEGESFITLKVRNVSLVTSGAYERYFVQDGKRYHHILDSKSGYPAQSDLLSVSIIGPSSTLCDALSTTLFVLGSEKGLPLIATYPGYACVLVKKDGKLLFSEDFPYPYQLSLDQEEG